jgi:hypothetical protein
MFKRRLSQKLKLRKKPDILGLYLFHRLKFEFVYLRTIKKLFRHRYIKVKMKFYKPKY